MLALIPLCGILFGLISGMESGILTVSLASEDGGGISDEIIEQLLCDEGVVRFVRSEPEEAIASVREGNADSAWIFISDLQEKIDKFAERQSQNNCLVRVYQREESVAMMLLREKLLGVLYPYVSHSFYVDYVKNEVLSEPESEVVESYYAAVMPEGSELFDFAFGGKEKAREGGYLSAPLRGILSIMTVIFGMSVSMMYRADEEKGLFLSLKGIRAPFTVFLYHFMAIFDIAAVMTLSLWFAGVSSMSLREMAILLLFSVATSVFCMNLECIWASTNALAALMPIIAISMAVICPVFVSLDFLRLPSLLFPTYYYLKMSVVDILVYILLMCGVYAFLSAFFGRGRNVP